MFLANWAGNAEVEDMFLGTSQDYDIPQAALADTIFETSKT